MNHTGINWSDETWNPTSGCYEISAGCKYCYAKELSENRRGTPAFPVGFDPVEKPWKLKEPLKEKTPSLIFVNSMSDLFLPEFSDGFRDQIFDVMRVAHWHRYQVLTKRPDIAAIYFETREVPPSMWMGTTIEHELTKLERLRELKSIRAPVLFLSCEPLIGRLDLAGHLEGIAWVIGGGESGKHLADAKIAEKRSMARRGGRGEPTWVPREDRMQWAIDMRDACAAAGAAFWWKQFGGTYPKSAGRLIEGVEHNGMPFHIAGAMPEGRGATQLRKQINLPVVP